VITFCRLRRTTEATEAWAAARSRQGTTVAELPAPAEDDLAACEARGMLAVALDDAAIEGTAAWAVDPAAAVRLARRGVPGWRITVLDEGPEEVVITALVRSGAAYLRTGRSRVSAASAIVGLPGISAVVSVFVDDVEEAVTAVSAGAGDLLLRDWDTERLGQLRDALGGVLLERTAFPPGLTIDDVREGLDPRTLAIYLRGTDGSGAARPRTDWSVGKDQPPPRPPHRLSAEWEDGAWVTEKPEVGLENASRPLAAILSRSLDGVAPTREEVEMLFRARGRDVEVIATVADCLRSRAVGDTVTYVVNRNVNYTNQCTFRCGFCAFAQGTRSLGLRGEPYLLEIHEVARRAAEAWDEGATEVCLQGGIHPSFTGDFYVSVIEAVKEVAPGIHVHGFTPLEVWQGAGTLGVSVRSFLARLRDAGLGSLPGTAAEILDDRVRRILCPDKIRTAEWAYVMRVAHDVGLRSTATMMFGHVDSPASWAEHFEVLRSIQRSTGGFTEIVPLPFVHMAAPIFVRGGARPGPTWDEIVLVHAIARIAFDGLIPNIQVSWVKLGFEGASALLSAGCNDLGGTLMDENISRAAGAAHGRRVGAQEMEEAIHRAGRVPARRSTLYGSLPDRAQAGGTTGPSRAPRSDTR
jgi:FO synthase